MARAKRTDRADARRRYRAAQGEVPAEGDDEATDATAQASGSAAKGRPQRRPAQNDQPVFAAGQRPSFTASFRAAARPFNIRDDIRYIPDLVLHTRAVWIPALVCLVAFALGATANGPNFVAVLLVQLFLFPPTIAGAFLAGILAPKATYIAGGIAGLIGSVLFVVLVLAFPNNLISLGSSAPAPSPAASDTASVAASGSAAASGSSGPSPSAAASAAPSISAAPTPSASPTTSTIDIASSSTAGAVILTIFESTAFGLAIGAFGGYYKRFLYVSNPSRQRRAIEQQKKNQRQQPPKRRF